MEAQRWVQVWLADPRPDGEFVIGSVVNLSIRGDEARDLLDQAWTNGHMLASVRKSLIRGSLKFGDKEIPPKVDVMRAGLV